MLDGTEFKWITLGTMSGPLPSAVRQQPANVLYDGVEAVMVDCGDGAVDQLCKAGLPLPAVRTVIGRMGAWLASEGRDVPDYVREAAVEAGAEGRTE